MGRHSKSNATFTKKALVGAATAMTLTGIVAPAANAAPDSDWDRLAQCEATGDWHIDTGNGFHGGLQFTADTWNAFGGGEFAPQANKATREQQIIVGERTLAGQGWGAWPACSAKLGLNSAATNRDQQEVPVVGASAAPVSAAPVSAEPSSAQSSSLEVDALYNSVVDRIQSFNIPVPVQLHDAYDAHRLDLNDFYLSVKPLIDAALSGNINAVLAQLSNR